jgi:hypothetical protein
MLGMWYAWKQGRTEGVPGQLEALWFFPQPKPPFWPSLIESKMKRKAELY